jgi:hypothetical protein
MKATEQLYDEMSRGGLDILVGRSRPAPGTEVQGREMVGVPVRVTLGERNLKDGNAELYYRLEDRNEIVPLDKVSNMVRATTPTCDRTVGRRAAGPGYKTKIGVSCETPICISSLSLKS